MKTILLLLLLTSSALAEVKAVISGPETANPGDLVVLYTTDSVGDNFVWIQPPKLQVLTCDSSKSLAFAVGTPGVYTFTLIAADTTAAIDYATHTVVVGTPPDPTPTPTPTPVTDFATISKSTAPADPETATRIVDAINLTAKFLADKQPTVPEASKVYQTNIGAAFDLRPRGTQADWVPWRKALEAEFRKHTLTVPALIGAYNQVALGLK